MFKSKFVSDLAGWIVVAASVSLVAFAIGPKESASKIVQENAKPIPGMASGPTVEEVAGNHGEADVVVTE